MWPHSQPSLHLQAATVGSTFPNVAGAPVPIPMIPGTQIPLHGHTAISHAQAQAAHPMPNPVNLMPNPALFVAGVPPPPFGGNAAAAAVASMAAAAAAAKEAEASAAAKNEEEAEEIKKNTLEVSHDGRYNLNHVMQDTILKSDYFKLLYDYKTFHEVLEEIIREVKHLEPHTRGHNRSPSTAFCLLYKFFVMKLTLRQIRSLISNEKHPYVRGIGCLYLRFIAPAKSLWDWFEDLLDDETEFVPTNDGVSKMKFGRWLEQLILEQKYYTTLFPRIPVPVMREYKKKMLLREMAKKRDMDHEKYRRSFTEGLKVEALYHDDNKWYKAQIDKLLPNGKYLVTFHGYTQKEVCSIGNIRPSAQTKLAAPSDNGRDRRSASKGSSSAAAARESSSKRRRSHSRSRSRKRDSKRSRRNSRSSSSKRSRSKSSSSSRSRSRSKSSRRSSRRSHRSSRSGGGSGKSKSSSHRSSRRSRRSRSRDRSSRRRRHRSRSRSRSRSRDRKKSKSSRSSRSSKSKKRSRSRSRSRSRRRHRHKKGSGSRSRSRSKSRSRRRRTHSRSRSAARRNGGGPSENGAEPVPDASEELDLDAIIRQRERDEALAVGRDYAKRPTSYKTSLSTTMVVGTARKRSRSPPPVHRSSRRTTTARSPSPELKKKKKPSKEHMEKMAKLRQQYGDASANKDGSD